VKSVSFVIPTYNSSNYIAGCLNSIVSQNVLDYEIIIVDGGSSDNTLDIIASYKNVKVFDNALVTAESAKKIGISHSISEYICLIDSDNLLSDDYIRRSINLFESDKEIQGVEPIKFTYNENLGIIDKYCSLMGVNDPMNLYFGNYDKLSVLFNRWTNINFEVTFSNKQNKNDKVYLFDGSKIPTFGANATLLKGNDLRKFVHNLQIDYYFDNDYLLYQLEKNNFRLKFGKVDLGVTHFYCGSSFKRFLQKQNRRIRDYIYYSDIRLASPVKKDKFKILLFIFDNLLILPLLFKTLFLFFKTRKIFLLAHFPLCIITFYVYTINSILFFFKGRKYFYRKSWLKS